MAAAKIQVKRANAAAWTSANTLLLAGEIGLELDTFKFKIGNGSTAWNSLAYSISSNLSASTLNDLGDVTITSAADGDFLRWNGTAWINDAVNLSTDTIGSYVQSLVAGAGVTLTNNSGEGATPTVAIGQSVATGDSPTFVNVTASLTGNASTATTLQTSRNIAGQAFNGSANISIASTDLTGVTADATELNILDGATLSTTELNYVDGVTSAIQTQIDTKAPLANPTFTGTVTIPTGASITAPTGLVKGDVGLGNVDNTNDANKPVSTAGQTALNLKANLASPTFTGTVTVPTPVGNTDASTKAYVDSTASTTAGNASTALANHEADTTNIHGVADTSILVTTTGTQTLTNKTITSPAGLVKGDVGLGNVDNTSDANKPVSTAGQTALDLKANLASPTFTGTVILPSGTVTSAMILDGTIVNADISASASIADTKLATISTASKVSNSATTADATNTASTIVARDASGNFAAGTVTAALAGNATTATTLATTRAIQISGDVTGTANFDGSAAINIVATIAADSVALGTDTSGSYVESLVAGTGVTLTNNSGEGATPTIAIGQAVGTGSNVTFNDLIVSGDLTVSGTTTSINTETLTIDDNIVVLNNNATGAPSQNAGLEIERGSSANVALRWNETSDKWEITEDGSTYYDIATVAYVDGQTILSLDDVGDVVITSATSGQFLKWNGTAWINDNVPVINNIDDITGVTITAAADKDFLMYNGTAWVDSPINLGTDTVGSFVESLTAGTGITLTNNSGEAATPTIAIGQAVGTSESVTFTQVTAALVGNSSTATVLQTARNIAGQSFNGSVNISIAPTDLTGVTSTAAELNILDGATLDVTELNYVDGVTSAIQTQINTKAAISGQTFTGAINTPNNSASMIPFYYANVASFPAASNSHGAFAHSHATGLMYYAHGGTWIELANLASPTFTGTPTLPTGTIATTQTAADSTTKVATTAFVTTALSLVTDSTTLLDGGNAFTIQYNTLGPVINAGSI